MPIMDVRFPAGRLNPAQKADLAQRLTDVLIRMEGGADTQGGRAFAWVLFTELGPADLWIGGRADGAFVSEPGPFLVRVSIPEGYMNAAHKNDVHRWVMEAVAEASGASPTRPDSGSVLVIIEEVTEGNWSSSGHTIDLASIANTVGMPPDGERMKWSRAYFEAKARARSAADYPPDTGGLWPTADPRG